MMAMDDVVEILAISLIGVVPDDESIVITTNKGEPAVSTSSSVAGKAFSNIARRILGEDVPFMDLDIPDKFVDKLKKLFGFMQ